MRLLKEKYKTWEGAHKRAGFENGVAKSEFNNGLKARLYKYSIVSERDYHTNNEIWRVARENV